ncbi:hypothetical protein JOY44_31005 (plasmid) [Phormidium sp. CLA17]|nr:hypothetical protein [Leptolyngbya sp. Cla-17]
MPLDTGQLQLPSLQGDLNGHYEWQGKQDYSHLRAGLEIQASNPCYGDKGQVPLASGGRISKPM